MFCHTTGLSSIPSMNCTVKDTNPAVTGTCLSTTKGMSTVPSINGAVKDHGLDNPTRQ